MTHKESMGFVLYDVARLMRKRFEQHAGSAGLSRSQWQVLSKLAKHEGIHQKALADLLEIQPITLGRLLDKMEGRDLIERRPHPTDRRLYLLFLKPAAQPFTTLMLNVVQQTREETLAGLSADEQKLLGDLLNRMRANLIDACGRPVEHAEVSDA